MSKIKNFDLYDYHHRSQHEILLSYKGPFEQEVLSIIAEYINVILAKNPKVSRKILKIFVELAQNVAYYSSERNIFKEDTSAGIGSITIIETEDSYTLYSGNQIPKKVIDQMIEKCEHINSLDTQELRAYRRKQLELPDGANDTANIGLIQIAITSSNPLGLKVTKCDTDNSFFAISVKINK